MMHINLFPRIEWDRLKARLKARRMREKRRTDPERQAAHLAKGRAWQNRRYKERATDPLYRAWINEKSKARRMARPEPHREQSNASRIKRLYGLTRVDYASLLEAQGGVCAICHREQKTHRDGTRDRLAVDHDHATGCVRGLLCHDCNHVLGKMGDDPARLRAAASYLERT